MIMGTKIYASNRHFDLLVVVHHVVFLVILFGSYSTLAQINYDTTKPFFVFGDSSLDVGNNNYVSCRAKGNYLPYGIDFENGRKPTGRFTNGRTIIDIIGQELGLKGLIPPYLDPTTIGDVIFHGVNYASGTAGILNETGKLFGERIIMDAQLDNFANTRQDIIERIGDPTAASNFLKKAVFTISMGANDLLDYLGAAQQTLVSQEILVNKILAKYKLQLTKLYNMDARKIVVANIGPIGCTPYLRDKNPWVAGDSCIAVPNQLATLFNNRLKGLIMELNSNLVESKFVYADVYSILSEIIVNYKSYGFEKSSYACCHLLGGQYGGWLPCIPLSAVCSNRTSYVFWDPYHFSDAANVIAAKRLLDGDANDIYPINFRQLFKEI